jgi:hypothetical protein
MEEHDDECTCPMCDVLRIMVASGDLEARTVDGETQYKLTAQGRQRAIERGLIDQMFIAGEGHA